MSRAQRPDAVRTGRGRWEVDDRGPGRRSPVISVTGRRVAVTAGPDGLDFRILDRSADQATPVGVTS